VLAHGTRLGTQLVFVKLEHDGATGFGEASLPPYLPENKFTVSKWVLDQKEQVEKNLIIEDFADFADSMPFSKENPAASAALEMALINWYFEKYKKRFEDFFEVTGRKPALTITLTKSDVNHLPEMLDAAKKFTHLKLKFTGENDDLDFYQEVCKNSDLPICVDANQGYSTKKAALEMISKLDLSRTTLVEQPLHAQDLQGHLWLTQHSPLPIVADESIRTYGDLVENHPYFDGVNIKLMKCGGIRQANKMLSFIEKMGRGYTKILGCMSESTLAVSMARNLSSHFDLADLDAPILNSNDPFESTNGLKPNW
jgi:L-alanine-DL-glutamate epimerase-like enolase superfamily enzyme